MYLKNDKKLPFNNKKPSRPNSIISRLTIGYVCISIVVLAGIAFFLYYSLVNNIQNKDLRFLVDKILHLRTILKEDHLSQHFLKQEVNEGGGYQFHKLLIKILDVNGSLVVVSKNGSKLIAKLPFPSPHEVDEDPWKFEKFQASNGKIFLMMSAWAISPNYSGKRVLLNTAIDITAEQDLLEDYRNILLYAIFCGILSAVALSIIIARHGLRPLKNISDSVQKTSMSRLHERLDPQQWPSELIPLVLNFDKMLDRIEDSVNRLSRFSSDIAHDLRTPLQTLRGEAEIALSENRTSKEYQEYIQSSLEEYEKLTHTIEGLLFITRAENTEIVIHKTEIDTKIEVHKIIEFYEALIEEKSITVVCNGNGKVYADPHLFERALSNVVSNAVKYTEHGGKIKLYVVENKDQTVSVSVNNNGIVIGPEEIRNIFDRFFRAPRAKVVDRTGLGLGLSIVKSIMDIHGGTIKTKSDRVTGTTFTLNFPPK